MRTMPVVSPCVYCAVQGSNRVWIDAEYAVAFATDPRFRRSYHRRAQGARQQRSCPPDRSAEGRVGPILGRTRPVANGLTPDAGFSIGFLDALSAQQLLDHAVVHVIRRRMGDHVVLPDCSEWIADDGVIASAP